MHYEVLHLDTNFQKEKPLGSLFQTLIPEHDLDTRKVFGLGHSFRITKSETDPR